METIERVIDTVLEQDWAGGFEIVGKTLFGMAAVASVGFWLFKFGWAIISFLYMMD